jgi:hypothetical protein
MMNRKGSQLSSREAAFVALAEKERKKVEDEERATVDRMMTNVHHSIKNTFDENKVGMSNGKMKSEIKAEREKLSMDEVLLGHYTDYKSACLIIDGLHSGATGDGGQDLGGFWVNTSGQGGGGVYFSKTMPHEMATPWDGASGKQQSNWKEFKRGVLEANYGKERAGDDFARNRVQVFILVSVPKSHIKKVADRDTAALVAKETVVQYKREQEAAKREKRAPRLFYGTSSNVVFRSAYLLEKPSSDDLRSSSTFDEEKIYATATGPTELREAIIDAVRTSEGDPNLAVQIVGLIGSTSFFRGGSDNDEWLLNQNICLQMGQALADEKSIVIVTGGLFKRGGDADTLHDEQTAFPSHGHGPVYTLAREFLRTRRTQRKSFLGLVHILPEKPHPDKDGKKRFTSISDMDPDDGTFGIVRDPDTADKTPLGYTARLGDSIHQREAYMSDIADVMILIEGGPGAVNEARNAANKLDANKVPDSVPVIPITGTSGAAEGAKGLWKEGKAQEDFAQRILCSDNLAVRHPVLGTPEGHKDWLTVTGKFRNDGEQQAVGESLVRVVKKLNVPSIQRANDMQSVLGNFKKAKPLWNTRKPKILGLVVGAPFSSRGDMGSNVAYNTSLFRAIGESLAEWFKERIDPGQPLAFVSLKEAKEENTVIREFNKSRKGMTGIDVSHPAFSPSRLLHLLHLPHLPHLPYLSHLPHIPHLPHLPHLILQIRF